jgi:hypothetical protein
MYLSTASLAASHCHLVARQLKFAGPGEIGSAQAQRGSAPHGSVLWTATLCRVVTDVRSSERDKAIRRGWLSYRNI